MEINPEAKELYEKGSQLFNESNYKEAIQVLFQAACK
jgi:hypothetical protein